MNKASNEIKVNEKEKVMFPQIVVRGTKDKPYYEIKYYDVTDKQWHLGYGSYNLEYVMQWKEECLEVIEGSITNDLCEKIKERLEEKSLGGMGCPQWIPLESAVESVNQVAEEYVPEINVGNNSGWIILPQIALDRMIARMESESERDIYEEESLFINVRDAARIVREIVREHSNSEFPNKSDDGWIPVSSGKMPENGRRCWVTYEWANGSLHVDKDYLVNGKWFETEDEAVKAWMYNDEETPEPYKPKGEK